MKRLGIVGCGFLGNIIANAWKQGLLEEYELVGVTSRSWESAEKTAQNTGVRACRDIDELLALKPDFCGRSCFGADCAGHHGKGPECGQRSGRAVHWCFCTG